jgi:hypothetical protein
VYFIFAYQRGCLGRSLCAQTNGAFGAHRTAHFAFAHWRISGNFLGNRVLGNQFLVETMPETIRFETCVSLDTLLDTCDLDTNSAA